MTADDERSLPVPFPAVLDQLREPILIYDQRGRLTFLNPAAAQLFAAHDVQIGDAGADLLAKLDATDERGRPFESVPGPIERALDGEIVEHLTISLRGSGPLRTFTISAVPLAVGGRRKGAVVVGHEVTPAQLAAEERVDVLAAAGHELRNPLAAVLSNAEIMQLELARGGAFRDPAKRLTTIIEQARLVSGLLRDLVDMWRADIGRLTLQPETVDVPVTVRRVVDAFSGDAEHAIRASLPPGPATALVDPHRLEQIVQHVLQSAARSAGPHGRLHVDVSHRDARVIVCVHSDEQARRRATALTDAGAPRLRTPRHEIDLDLRFAGSLVLAQGGNLWVEDTPSGGRVVCFDLPSAFASPAGDRA